MVLDGERDVTDCLSNSHTVMKKRKHKSTLELSVDDEIDAEVQR